MQKTKQNKSKLDIDRVCFIVFYSFIWKREWYKKVKKKPVYIWTHIKAKLLSIAYNFKNIENNSSEYQLSIVQTTKQKIKSTRLDNKMIYFPTFNLNRLKCTIAVSFYSLKWDYCIANCVFGFDRLQ